MRILIRLFVSIIALTILKTTQANTQNVLDYGALPNDSVDDSSAFKSALNALKNTGGGVLLIPPGDYLFKSQVFMLTSQWDIEIYGAGKGVTRLVSDHNDGIFRFKHTATGSTVALADLTLFSNRAGAGTALNIVNDQLDTVVPKQVVIENVDIRPKDRKVDYFNYGIRLTNVHQPQLKEVTIGHTYGPGSTNKQATTSNFKFNNVTSPYFLNCYSWNAINGYDIGLNSGKATSIHSFAVGCSNGYVIQGGSAVIMDAHVNCDKIGIHLKNLSSFKVERGLFYTAHEIEALNYIDIKVNNSGNGEVIGSIFHMDGSNTRKMIRITGAASDNIEVDGCIFNAPGTEISKGPGIGTVTEKTNLSNGGITVL